MADIGNIIKGLSTDVPLSAGATWVSQATVLGEYNSITVNIKSNQTSTLRIKWSADGVNWDRQTTETIPASIGTPISLVVSNKVLQLELTNTGAGPMTYLRLNSYGVVTNNSTLAILVGDISGKIPELKIANLFQNSLGIPVQESELLESITFQGFTGTTVNALTVPLEQLYFNSSDNTATTFNPGLNGIALELAATTSGSYTCLGSENFHSFTPGSIYEITMTASFEAGSNTECFFGFGIGNASTAGVGNGVFTSSVGFGCVDGDYGIIWRKNVVSIFIPQSSWNVDPFDGSGSASRVLVMTQYNNYRIIYDSQGSCVLMVEDTDGVFKPCHILNDHPNLEGRRAGMLAYTLATGVTTPTSNLVVPIFWGVSELQRRSKYMENNITWRNQPAALTLSTASNTYFRYNTTTFESRRYFIDTLMLTSYESAGTSPPFLIYGFIFKVASHAGGSWVAIGSPFNALEYNAGGTGVTQEIMRGFQFQSNATSPVIPIGMEIYPDVVYGVQLITNTSPAGAGLGGIVSHVMNFKEMS